VRITVIPAQAGIQCFGEVCVSASLDPRLRGGDGRTKFYEQSPQRGVMEDTGQYPMGEKSIVQNRMARRNYQILDTFEAGIVLQGTEVKSLREAGSMTLKDSYADIRKGGELYLVGAHINPYKQGNIYNHEPERPRKLLMHKREIEKLAQRIAEKGLTLIPLSIYFKKGIVKVELGLGRGKNVADKRETIKARESKIEMDRAMKHLGRK